jgi:hypothetical protein
VYGRFGSWNAGLHAAGLEVNHERRCSRESVLAALRADAAQRGRPPRQHEWRRPTALRPSATAVHQLFGSWNRGLDAAGLTVSSRPRLARSNRGQEAFGSWTAAKHATTLATQRKVPAWTELEIVAALNACRRELGRSPTWKEWKGLSAKRGWPSTTTLTNRYGHWGDVLETAGPTPRRGEP